VFQSVFEDSETVSANDCDCPEPGTGGVDWFNAIEGGNGDKVVAEYFFDIGDGKIGESDWEFDGGFESGECEIAGAGGANRPGVDEGRLRECAESAGAKRLGD